MVYEAKTAGGAKAGGGGGRASKRPQAVAKAALEVRGVDDVVQYRCALVGGGEQWLDDEAVPPAVVAAFVRTHRAELPLPENVDVVTGGPPCQGVSGFNKHRHEDVMADYKNFQTQVFAQM